MSNLPDLLNNNFYKKPSEYDAELKNVIGNTSQQQLQSQEDSN